MNRALRLLYVLTLLIFGASLFAQQPERELRGVWMATVLNIDYPKNPTDNSTTLQAEFRSQLYRLRQAGINTIFVQVRPAGDALYPTKLALWSEWLTGYQGKPPSADFDPLKFMIEEAHSKGVELHAWVNPYRVSMSLDSTKFASNHLFRTHRDWVRIYGERMYLDPGMPEVRAHLGKVINELVTRYDLDGIHFDDYFYPYPIEGETFPDAATYAHYGNGASLGHWRRKNVDKFVAETHKRIKDKKPWMRFGISPFGVWRNKSEDPTRGSNTRARATSYDQLYGNALAWANAGTVDYLMPQLYWNIGYEPADYSELVQWWAKNTPKATKLYVGHAAYKVGVSEQSTNWHNLEEIPRQVMLMRNLERYSGSAYFSARSFLEGRLGLSERIGDLYPTIALPPPVKSGNARLAPVKQLKPKQTEKGRLIVWDIDKDTPEDRRPYYFAIYRSSAATPKTLIHITPFGQKDCSRFHFYDKRADGIVEYTYEVQPIDRYHRSTAQSAR